MGRFILFLGAAGSFLNLSGALPQIIHLLRVKDSTGQSPIAWLIWITSNVMLLIYAIYLKNLVFILLEAVWVIFTILTLLLVVKYRRKET